MKKTSLLALCAIFAATACNTTTNENKQATADSVATVVEKPEPLPVVIKESEFYYDFDSTSAMKLSDPIFYEVVIKNHKKDDDWQTQIFYRLQIQYFRPFIKAS